MKNLLYVLVAIMTLGSVFVSCKSDDNDPNYNQNGTPATASAATYSGTWSRSQSDGETETASGTITLAAGSNDYTTNITFSCPDFNINNTSVANITWANDGFVFNQNKTDKNPDNELGAIYAGHIINGQLNTIFSKTTKVGRKTTTFYYSFTGSK